MTNVLTTEMTLAEVFAITDKVNVKEIDTEALWYDWFCKDTALHNRGINLLRRLKKIKNSEKFDINNTYVFFRNNWPMRGTLYDDFRICDKKTGDVIFTVIPKDTDGGSTVWGKENGFKEPIIKGTWKDIKEYFLN